MDSIPTLDRSTFLGSRRDAGIFDGGSDELIDGITQMRYADIYVNSVSEMSGVNDAAPLTCKDVARPPSTAASGSRASALSTRQMRSGSIDTDKRADCVNGFVCASSHGSRMTDYIGYTANDWADPDNDPVLPNLATEALTTQQLARDARDQLALGLGLLGNPERDVAASRMLGVLIVIDADTGIQFEQLPEIREFARSVVEGRAA